MEKGDMEAGDAPRNMSTSSHRRGSFGEAVTTSGRHANVVRDLNYVDHREGDDRADEAKGRDSQGFKNNYWYSANFIGTLLAIGFSFMAGIGGKIDCIFCARHCIR